MTYPPHVNNTAVLVDSLFLIAFLTIPLPVKHNILLILHVMSKLDINLIICKQVHTTTWYIFLRACFVTNSLRTNSEHAVTVFQSQNSSPLQLRHLLQNHLDLLSNSFSRTALSLCTASTFFLNSLASLSKVAFSLCKVSFSLCKMPFSLCKVTFSFCKVHHMVAFWSTRVTFSSCKSTFSPHKAVFLSARPSFHPAWWLFHPARWLFPFARWLFHSARRPFHSARRLFHSARWFLLICGYPRSARHNKE